MDRFPPRSTLPRTIEIEKVPMVGTTWYERGFRYWLRRFFMVVVSAGVLTLMTALLWGFFDAIRQSSVTGFWIALAIEIVYSLATIAYIAIRTKQHWNDTKPVARKPVNRAAGQAGAVLGTLAQAGLFIGQLFLVIATLLFAGLYVALFIGMLMPETVWERPARLRMADLLARRGVPHGSV
jgi:hypothetical protein